MSEAAAQVRERISRADRNGALDLATEALKSGDRHPLILMLAAERLEERGELARALLLLDEAVPQASDVAELWRRYGLLRARQGLHPEGRDALERANELLPGSPPVLEALGTACLALADLDAAERHFRHLAEIAPDKAAPLAGLAAIAARRGRTDEALTLGDRALALEPDNIVAALAIARHDLEVGLIEEAEARADALLDRVGLAHDAAVGLLGLRADARDALGSADEAYADYVARNELVRRRVEPVIARTANERRVDQARRLKRYYDARPPLAPAPAFSADAGGPAAVLFILGFPRSGTTLLEKALAGHNAVRTLPEVDILGQLAGDLLDSANLRRLDGMGPAEIARLRQAYFERAAIEVGSLADTVLVDKLPLHSLSLPIIARLFPEAKLVLSLRDPRDVVLSAIRRRFQMNSAMFELLRPADALNFYEAVMALIETYRRALPISLVEVRHEDLVNRFRQEVERVLALVGLYWQPTIAEFAERARNRARTPSDLQLTRGLNSEGVGTWRRYRSALAPLLPRLTPWVERFGYRSD